MSFQLWQKLIYVLKGKYVKIIYNNKEMIINSKMK